MKRYQSFLLAGAFAASMGAGSAWSATLNNLGSSTQGAGNTADIYASNYGAIKPSSWSWSSDPTVIVPPGNASGVYQSPFNNTGLVSTRNYFSVGATNGDNGAPSPVTLTFGGQLLDSFTLLWGSIDDYNTLSFFDGLGDLIIAYTGADIIAEFGLGGSPGNFEQVALVGITGLGGAAFATFTSTSAAFEFGLVPIPAALPLFGTALGGLLLLRSRRKRSATSAVPV